MHIRTLALLLALMPAAVAAQETLVLASVVEPEPPLAADSPAPRVVAGGAVRVADAPQATPGLWLNF